jgi:hypothetical protein
LPVGGRPSPLSVRLNGLALRGGLDHGAPSKCTVRWWLPKRVGNSDRRGGDASRIDRETLQRHRSQLQTAVQWMSGRLGRTAPAALCGASTLRRAVLSVVREGTMLAEWAYFVDDRRGARDTLAQLRTQPVVLAHPLIETELLRRPRATIVVDAHIHPRVDRRTAELMSWHSCVATPLLAGTNVIGVLHADRSRPTARRAGSGCPVGALQRTGSGLRERELAAHASSRARADASVPGVDRCPLGGAHRRPNDAGEPRARFGAAA